MKPVLLLMAGWALLVVPIRAESSSDAIAATVNGEAITVAQITEQTKDWPTARLEERKREVLQALIDRALIIQAFYREGSHVPDAYIDERLNQIVKEEYGGDRALFEHSIAERSITLEKYRQEIANNYIVGHQRALHSSTWQASLRRDANIKIY